MWTTGTLCHNNFYRRYISPLINFYEIIRIESCRNSKGGKGKGKVNSVNLVNKICTRLNQKLFFIRSVDAGLLLDSNYVGKVVLSEPDNNRQVYQKHEFSSTEIPGVYFIKSVLSGLYLSGDE